MSTPRTIIIGGGLAGLSAAHTVIENGGRVLLLDKKPSLGGNSVKASSGINGAGTKTQSNLNIEDSVERFVEDSTTSAGPELARPHLINALTSNSKSAITWLTDTFNVDLSLVSRLGGHSIARTHRGKGGAPGWAITSSLIKALEKQESAQIVKGANVVELVQENAQVKGVRYKSGAGEVIIELGAVIVATGGYGADFSGDGYLSKFRPDLLDLPTTNGDHATGDGHRLASSLSHPAALCDMDQVQVHPTGFVDPKDTSAKTKFLAAEALRGAGGLLIDSQGHRFVNELDRRDAVTAKMYEAIQAGHAPLRMVMNLASYESLKAHCDFYLSKGLMKRYESAEELSAEAKIPLDTLERTFSDYTSFATGKSSDPFGKSTFENVEYKTDAPLFVAELTPVVHYTMGGISVDDSARVLDASSSPIPGLFAAGEVIGGVHGRNRLAGSSLLEAVVFGRLAGAQATKQT